MFSPQALTCRCAIVSDSDPAIDEEGNEIPTSATADSLARFVSDQHQVRLAEKTFEWDLAYANYDHPELILKALKTVRPIVGAKVAATRFGSPEEFADEVLFRVKAYKGPFAQELASLLSESASVAFSI